MMGYSTSLFSAERRHGLDRCSEATGFGWDYVPLLEKLFFGFTDFINLALICQWF